MTILEIAERVEKGETVQIPAGHWGEFFAQSEAHLKGSHCWKIEVKDGAMTIRKAEPK